MSWKCMSLQSILNNNDEGTLGCAVIHMKRKRKSKETGNSAPPNTVVDDDYFSVFFLPCLALHNFDFATKPVH